MKDSELTVAWAVLEPLAHQRRRIEARVLEWIEARETSLAAEWLALLKVNPVTVLSLAAMGSFALLLLTPLGWVAASVLL